MIQNRRAYQLIHCHTRILSNGGISVQSGKVVCVDKGEWDINVIMVT